MMKDILKTLCTAYGATGREDNVAGVIRAMIAPYVDETRFDALGNLIAVKKGMGEGVGKRAGKRVMLAAHMDQIGFVVTDIEAVSATEMHPTSLRQFPEFLLKIV